MDSIACIELSRVEVTDRARQLWKAAGCPTGRDLEYWLQAEVELLTTAKAAHANNGNSGADSPPTFGVANPALWVNGVTPANIAVRGTDGNGKANSKRAASSRTCRAWQT